MTTLSDQTAALSRELDELTHGQVKHEFVSNPTMRPDGERWTITAYGESHAGLSTTAAHGLLVAWRDALHRARARVLTQRELTTARRIDLHRTASGGWRISTQKIDGVPEVDGWKVTDTDQHAGPSLFQLADFVLEQHDYRRLWEWTVDQAAILSLNIPVRYLTVATKGKS